ncbi:NfeD family protein [Flavobacterium sp.]|uniref:NfeD family protein n=1 Tax=Flavobacterium sp. TaxID=239 RepID=UPI00352894C4
MTFLENYDTLLKAFWYIALPISIFFLLQTIMTFLGLGGADTDTDFDTDVDGHDSGDTPFELFTLRNLINFLLGFSWTGIAFYNRFENKTILISLATIVGVIFVLLFFFLIKQILKLSEDNSFKLTDTIGKTAEVYLTIPENKTGKGKIQISVKGSVHELEAVSLNPEKITSNSMVKVVSVENQTVVVEKI